MELMLTSLKNLFWDPDPFEGDPWSFAANQIAHFAAVGFVPVMLGAPVLIVLGLFAAWEAGQVLIAKGEVWDSLEDIGFVTCGALAVTWWPAAVVAGVFLAAGAARRTPI